MKKQLYRAAAATVLGLSLTTGIVAADTGNIHTTGPGSRNTIHSRVKNEAKVTNDNDINVTNSNSQSAHTGNASVRWNTTGGDAMSGDATNHNQTSADIQVDNSASTANLDPSSMASTDNQASITNTGPGSDNRVDNNVQNKLTISNDNDIDVRNTNTQTATSGSANVSGNTSGGDATSGNASNSNSTSFTISVTN